MAFLDDLLRTAAREGGAGGAYPTVPDIGSFGLGIAQPPPSAGLGPQPGPQRQPSQQGPQKPMYRPAELQELEMLQQAIAAGLDPSFAMSEFQRITGGLDARQAMFSEKQAARKANLQGLASMGPQAAELISAGVPPGAVDQMYQGFGGPVERGLDSIIAQVAGSSEGGEAGGLNSETVTGISDHAADLHAAGYPLHNARVVIMGRLREQGFSDTQLADAYDLIGQQYGGFGALAGEDPTTGLPTQTNPIGNTPLTYEDRLGQLAATTGTRPGQSPYVEWQVGQPPAAGPATPIASPAPVPPVPLTRYPGLEGLLRR